MKLVMSMLGVAIALAFLAGCSSTGDTQETSGTAASSSTGRSAEQPADAAPDKVAPFDAYKQEFADRAGKDAPGMCGNPAAGPSAGAPVTDVNGEAYEQWCRRNGYEPGPSCPAA